MMMFQKHWALLYLMLCLLMLLALLMLLKEHQNLWRAEKKVGHSPWSVWMSGIQQHTGDLHGLETRVRKVEDTSKCKLLGKLPETQPENQQQIQLGKQSTPQNQPQIQLGKQSTPQNKRHSSAREYYIPEIDRLSPENLLNSNYIPNTVFYIWCGRRWLEFHHYLSIKSVIQEFKPDNLIFYYDTLPVDDYWIYNTWFRELQTEYPFFRLQPAREKDPWGNLCQAPSKPNLDYVYKRLFERGGIFVSEYTIIDSVPVTYRKYSVVHALDIDTMRGFIMAKHNVPIAQMIHSAKSRHEVKLLHCASSNTTYDLSIEKPPCVHTLDHFFPADIWQLDSDFGRLARRIFYRTTQILHPEPSYDELVPNIAHMVWIGGGEMNFLFYLSVLSLIYVAKVDDVYIHGNAPPTGQYWQRIQGHPKLHLIYREIPKKIFGNNLHVRSHVSDAWRVDFMIRYGGIYVDTDTIMVKPLSNEIRGYEAVASVEWERWNQPFPNTMNFGVFLGKKNAPFLREFQNSMKWWIDTDWTWNGLRRPYKIKERRPDLLKIDSHLQVICYECKCHPTWWPQYYNESMHHGNSPSIKNWRTDAYAYHWTVPTPPEFRSEEAAFSYDTMFAEMAQYILRKAGVIKKGHKVAVSAKNMDNYERDCKFHGKYKWKSVPKY